jgi:hypothetical protein
MVVVLAGVAEPEEEDPIAFVEHDDTRRSSDRDTHRTAVSASVRSVTRGS